MAGPSNDQAGWANDRKAAGKAPLIRRCGWLCLLCVMSFVDGIGRGLLPTFAHRLPGEFGLDNSQAGWLLMTPLIGGVVGAIAVGWFVDRYWRPRLLALSYALASAAIAAVAMVAESTGLWVALFAMGMGSTCFIVTALTLVADEFEPGLRAVALASLLLAGPIGVLWAPLFVAWVEHYAPWQTGLIGPAAIGLGLAMVALILRAPVRGESEGVDPARLQLHETLGASPADYVDLMLNSSYTYSVFGLTFASFAIAGIHSWGRPYLAARSGISWRPSVEAARILFQLAVMGGVIAGGVLAARSQRQARQLFLLPGLSMFAAAALLLIALRLEDTRATAAGICLALFCTACEIVPCYTIITQVALPTLRGTACGIAVASALLAGDLLAPPILGIAVDMFTPADAMATPFGRLLAFLGATPQALPGFDPQNSAAGLVGTVPALLIAGLVLLAGVRHIQRESNLMLANLRAIPRSAPPPKTSQTPRHTAN